MLNKQLFLLRCFIHVCACFVDKVMVKPKCPRNVTAAKNFIENRDEILESSNISKIFTVGSREWPSAVICYDERSHSFYSVRNLSTILSFAIPRYVISGIAIASTTKTG